MINYELKIVVAKRNIRQKKVADDLGIPYVKFRRIVGGFIIARKETEMIARYLNITPSKVNYRYNNGDKKRKQAYQLQDIV
jgi:hypothetical protein